MLVIISAEFWPIFSILVEVINLIFHKYLMGYHRKTPAMFLWAPCILWIGVMDWSLGLEPWSGVLEWILGVEPWSEMLECVRETFILVVKLVSFEWTR